ncbi:uncharacterized protein LTR77_007430 [Saxophila tyrrhenica]|uniref:Uncharacterized protein n=1 Tax=Saxophila tyrrhenica TaxID=1690608 RepID=A0AAV9P4R6_9PEZI|nr:hypothetical protein LTR77_007430 [Saxophila tyrrhenica]
MPTSSSTIHWGPAITAPTYTPAPTGSPSSQQTMPSQPTNGFSADAKKIVIAVTTIGGTFILALLLYALWRRRKGHTYSDIIHFRRHSGTIILGSTRDERLTALPIYQETRYSVRSSKHGSTLNFGKHARRPSAVPSAVAQRFYAQNPWVQDVWQSGGPPTPTGQKHPLSQVANASAQDLKAPEMVRVYSSHGDKDERNPQSQHGKPHPSIAVRPASSPKEDKDDEESVHEAKDDRPERWSWTNSQAPPTPRMYAPSMHSSLSSLPRFRKVKSWVRNQTERQTTRIDEERGLHSRSGSEMPILKNKASKPNLAPKVTRKLSKKSLHSDGSPILIQSNTDVAGPVRPPSARVRGDVPPRITPI